MSERRPSPLPPESRRRFPGSWKAWSNAGVLLVSAAILVFLVWNRLTHGTAILADPGFQEWAAWLLLLLCFTLALNLLLDAGSAWREGLERRALPLARIAPEGKERSFQTAGPSRPVTRHFLGHFGRNFRRFYAFHRYEPPYVAHYYFAKSGSLSLLGLPCTKAGLLLLFLAFHGSLAEGELSVLPSAILAAGLFFVIFGLLTRWTVPYRKVWLRMVEEQNRVCLTLSFSGPAKDRWFDTFCKSFAGHSGIVSCSTQSR